MSPTLPANSEQLADAAPMRMTAYVPVALLTLGSLAWSASLHLAPKDPRLVMAIFSPFSTAEAAFLAAAQAGTVVSIGERPFMLTVSSDDNYLAERLRAAGAIAVINSNRPQMCGQTPRANG